HSQPPIRFTPTLDVVGVGVKRIGTHWSLTTLREKLVKIGAKVVRHGRYVTFQLAEVAVPRELFRKILSLIDDLRRRPIPA
ncbi:MAG: transposase, partial [Verrucomicrobiota bacterium]|nr:transposase [Verrucomicrobiota bacterium]